MYVIKQILPKIFSVGIIKPPKNVKILNGPYGPYIQKGNKRVPVPKDKVPQKLTAKECGEIVKNYKRQPENEIIIENRTTSWIKLESGDLIKKYSFSYNQINNQNDNSMIQT